MPRYFNLACVAYSRPFTYEFNVIIREGTIAMALSAFIKHVFVVFGLCPSDEMGRLTAASIITSVSDVQSFGFEAGRKFKSDHMDSEWSTASPMVDDPITFTKAMLPFKTLINALKAAPKLLFGLWSLPS